MTHATEITEDSEVIFVAWSDQASNDVQGRLYEETFDDDGRTQVVKALGPVTTLNSHVDGFQGNHDIAQLGGDTNFVSTSGDLLVFGTRDLLHLAIVLLVTQREGFSRKTAYRVVMKVRYLARTVH